MCVCLRIHLHNYYTCIVKPLIKEIVCVCMSVVISACI